MARMAFFPDSCVVAEVVPSPNYGERKDGRSPDMILLHYTGMQDADAALERLTSRSSEVSAHYFVFEDGRIVQLVEESRRAWHAGVSSWAGETDINSCSIGIEIVNPGHAWGYRDFPVVQMAAVSNLCLEILSRHPISSRNVVAHSDVAPDRKEDPGERFDWHGLARNGVGLWPEGVPDRGAGGAVRDAAGLRDVRRALATIGYRVATEGPLDQALARVLRAFQRHWRPEAITGQADDGTRVRALAVEQLVGGN